jgi:hypothetical protein
MRSPLSAGLAMLLLQGCVPAQLSGYMPVSPGRLVSNRCNTVDDTITFDVGRSLNVTVNVAHKSPAYLHASLFVATGNTVSLLSEDFILASPDWPQPLTLRIEGIAPPSRPSRAPTSELRGERTTHYTAWGSVERIEEGSRFLVRFRRDPASMAPLSVKAFTLRLPEVSINGEKHQVPPVRFEQYSKFGFSGFCN